MAARSATCAPPPDRDGRSSASAGYFKDPITAHGITDAFRDAQVLADTVVAAGARALEGLQDKRDALSEQLFATTDAIASFDWDLDELEVSASGPNACAQGRARSHVRRAGDGRSKAA